MLAHLVAYVGALALLAIVGIHLWDELPASDALKPPPEQIWRVLCAHTRAFAVSEFDLPEKTEAYEILRHPDGGRKDILRWGPQGRGRSQRSKSIAPAVKRGRIAHGPVPPRTRKASTAPNCFDDSGRLKLVQAIGIDSRG